MKEHVLKIKLIEGKLNIANIEVKNITGDAEISIRKGKQILIYDLSLEVEWQAMTNEDVADGTYKVTDINPFDMDFEIDHIKYEE